VAAHPELQHDVSNIDWVTRDVNSMKHNLTPNGFLAMAEKILRRCRRPLTASWVWGAPDFLGMSRSEETIKQLTNKEIYDEAATNKHHLYGAC
jgi:hypothetical protein